MPISASPRTRSWPNAWPAEAAEPLGIPVFPVLAYGMTPGFTAYPGTISLRMSTYVALIEDLLEGCYRSGFRRIVLVNGHGGNAPIMTLATEWVGTPARCQRENA